MPTWARAAATASGIALPSWRPSSAPSASVASATATEVTVGGEREKRDGGDGIGGECQLIVPRRRARTGGQRPAPARGDHPCRLAAPRTGAQ